MSRANSCETITNTPDFVVDLPGYGTSVLHVAADSTLTTSAAHPRDYVRATEPASTRYPAAGSLGKFNFTAGQAALDQARQIFPESELTILSLHGTTAVVLRDGKGNAFKVARNCDDYAGVENEAAVLRLLSSRGLAPELRALIDAPARARRQQPIDGQTGYGTVDIPRINGGCRLPIIVFDEIVRPRPIATVRADELLVEFERFAREIDGLGMAFSGDTELVFNQSGRMLLLDARMVYRYEPDCLHTAFDRKAYEGLTYAEAARLYSITSLASLISMARTGIWCNAFEVRQALERGGITGVRSFLQHKLTAHRLTQLLRGQQQII